MRLFKCMAPEDEEHANSKHIDREIKNWIKSYNDSVKLLLLGTGESGKTTIIKQMKILHIKGFSASERQEKIHFIHHNVHESIHDIVRNMEYLDIDLEDGHLLRSVQYILSMGLDGPNVYTKDYFYHVELLWRDAGVKECFRRSNEYQLIDSAEYFLDQLDVISQADYTPSDAHILRCRQKTSGIQKIEFQVQVPKAIHGGTQEFWMFDVGGQRGERKKWIQVFEGINAIWFIVASSDFDQTLREDPSQNRLTEAIALFEDVWHSRFLLDAGLIVFMNKQDVLERKVREGRKIGKYFPKYEQYRIGSEIAGNQGNDEYMRAKTFIRSLFVDVTQKEVMRSRMSVGPDRFIPLEALRPRECFYHFTTATDTDNVRKVFNDVHLIILTHILASVGVL